MAYRGFSAQVVLAVVGAVLILGAFLYVTVVKTPESGVPAVSKPNDATQGEKQETSTPAPTSSTQTPSTQKPSATVPPTTKPTAPAAKPPSTTGVGTSAPPSSGTAPTPTPTPTPAPAPAPYNPGFLADSRVTPEIPSENERAKLPSCEGKQFTLDPVYLSSVTSISANGSMSGSAVPDYAVFKVVGTGELNKYDAVLPSDAWITHIAQETNISADPEDWTIYFALCKDVVGYVTHIKELSSATLKLVTDTLCFGKPHSGPNACYIKILELMSRGTALGKVGRFEGAFGVGLIDLRKERGLLNPSQYPIKTNFAACPFDYFSGKENYYAKLSGTSSLCSAP